MRTSEAGASRCALVRPLPPRSGKAWHARSIASAYAKKSPVAVRSDAYLIGPRITHVDRVIIRGYFHQHDREQHPNRRRPVDAPASDAWPD